MIGVDARGCGISGATPGALEAYERALATFQSWRSGLTIRPDSVQAMADAISSVAKANSAPKVKRRSTGAKAMSVGSPTETSQGTSFALDEPVMRSTRSDHAARSLASRVAM